jgi:outer membrane protein
MKLRNAMIGGLAILLAGPVWAQTRPARAASEAPTRVAVINIQTAIGSTAEGKQAAQEIVTKFTPRRTEVENMSKQVQNLQQRLQNGQSTLSNGEKARLMRQYQELSRRLQRKQQEMQEDYQAAQNDAINTIGGKMVSVIDRYAKEHGYSVVLDNSPQSNSAVLYASNAVDITSAIVKLYDQTYPVKSAAPAKPKAKQ